MANRNFPSAGKMYSAHTKPVLLDCNFIVDSSNGNGLGIRSLKGGLIQNVFMHTSATPGGGNENPRTPAITVTNPNPAAGVIVVQFEDSWARFLSGGRSIVSPVSGSTKVDNSALTAGHAYVITTLGTSTAAQWHSIGVPAGVTPAVGVAFIASAVGIAGEANTSTSRVMSAVSSGVFKIESVGDANLANAPSFAGNQGFGAQLILQCFDAAGALVAPTDGTTISLQFLINDSSIQIAGE